MSTSGPAFLSVGGGGAPTRVLCQIGRHNRRFCDRQAQIAHFFNTEILKGVIYNVLLLSGAIRDVSRPLITDKRTEGFLSLDKFSSTVNTSLFSTSFCCRLCLLITFDTVSNRSAITMDHLWLAHLKGRRKLVDLSCSRLLVVAFYLEGLYAQ